MAICTRCGGTGFLNTHQLPAGVNEQDKQAVLDWIDLTPSSEHDVSVCDCCGNGELWNVREPGHHCASDPHPYDCM